MTDGGAVLCWGSNAAGQLGDNSREDSTVPVAVSGLGDGIHTLVAGVNHTCVLTDGGAVLCWGDNEAGQLGDNSSEDSHIPVAVFGVSRGVSALVAGTNYTCALTDVGTLLCWGTNNLGPLPWQISSLANRSIPTPMNRSDLARKVTAIAAQGNLICALYDVGTVECWGQDNTNGLSATYENLQSIPIPLAWFKDGTEDPPTQAHDRKTAARGFAHTCSLTDVGSVVCWGANDTGQLGNGSTRKTTPVHVLAKIIIAPENDPQLLLPTPTPTLPIPTPTVAATVTTAAAVSLLPTITPTPRSSDLLPAPLYFLAPDQQIWQLTGSASNVISQTITHEPWPIVSFDFSPIHGRFVYITANQLVEFDPKTNTRIVKIKGPALPPTQADGRYTIEQIGTLVLGTPRYSPDGTQIAYTQAGVNLVRSGFEGTSTPQRLLRNVLWLESLMTPLASTVDWTTNVGEIRLYGGEMIWSPDGKKLLLGYTGWEWYGYEIYDQVTASLVSLPIGVNGEWQWRKDNGMGIVANSGYGGVFDSGLFLVDAQDAATHRLDLTSLNVTVEENPFTPLARAAYELPSGEIFFFMGTRFLRQDSSHSIFYALAEINPATNSLSWVQAEENRQEVELGEVLWSVDGSGVVNSRPSTPLQWLPVDGSPAIDLGIIGNNLRWGTTPTAETIIPVPTFTATPTAVPTLLPTPADLVTPPAPTFAPATPIPNLGHEATKGANQ